MITETLRDRLSCLLELSQSGHPGERTAAKETLEKLLKENNLTIDDIDSGEVKVRWVKVGRNFELKELATQIYFMVTDTHEADIYYESGKQNFIGFRMTAAQAANVEAYYSVLAPALQKEMARYRKLVVDAFVRKNKLVPASPGPSRDVSPEERRYLDSVWGFQNAIDKVDFRRQTER